MAMPRITKERVMSLKESINKIDDNNLKALAILKSVLFTLVNGGDDDFDIVSALEAVQDYLTDTNEIFSVGA